MNKHRNFGNTDLSRIVKSVLKEQVIQTTTTTPTTSTVQNTQPSTGTTPSNTATTTPTTATTTPTTATTDQDVLVTFGTDSNAKAIEDRVRKKLGQRIKDIFKRKPQVPTNESFNSRLLEEMNKMSFHLNYERGVVLSEQKTLLESDGSDTEKPPFNAPLVSIKKLNNTEWRVNAFGTFPVNVTTGPLATQFMDAIVAKVYQDPMLADPKYKGRVTMTIAHIFGGASNYNSGPVKPDMDAIYEQAKGSVKYVQSKPVTDDSVFTGNYELNTKLALNRAVNLFKVLKTQLPLRTANPIKMSVQEEIKGYNVNTGGVIDKDRNSKLYPVPGQHVNMVLTIKIRPENPSKVGSLECMKGLQIKVETTQHGCDTAAFDVKLNTFKLGAVDLGNDVVGVPGKRDELGKIREQLPNCYSDGKSGGKRYRIFKIEDGQIKSIVTSADGSITVFIKGHDSVQYERRFGLTANQSYAGTMSTHADVPFVTISRGSNIIYQQAPTPNTYAFGGSRKPCGAAGNPCQEYGLIKFNPCATNVIDGDLTGF